jgi:hypothetical protein
MMHYASNSVQFKVDFAASGKVSAAEPERSQTMRREA